MNSGATMTSLKISAIPSAHPGSSGRFVAIIPPKGAWRSVANAFSHASHKVTPCPTPQGLVCLRMATVGGSAMNWATRLAAAVRSRMLL